MRIINWTALAALLLCGYVVPTKSALVYSGKTSCPASGNLTVGNGVSMPVSWAVIQTPTGNAGTVTIGNNSVVSLSGAVLAANGSITMQTKGNNGVNYNLGRDVYFACSNSADAVTYVGFQ